MTNFSDELRSMIVDFLSSPKTTAVAATSSAAMGTALAFDIIRGAMAIAAVGSGVLASLMLARYHYMNTKKVKIEYMLQRQRAIEKGLDPDKE